MRLGLEAGMQMTTTAIAVTNRERFHVEQARPVHEPLFDGAHQALLFAYTFTPNQHAVAAAAERQLAAFGRERYERLRFVSRGLRGLDGAAQAGMIKRHVEALPPMARSLIEARFAILQPTIRTPAMRYLVLRLRDPSRGLDVATLSWAVQRHFGCAVTVTEAAALLRVAQRTLERRWQQVRRTLQAREDEAMGRMHGVLELAGVVGG